MTKNEALQMCLEYIETDAHERKYVRHAIKTVLEQPEQEPVAWNVIDPTGNILATEKNAIRGWARVNGYKPTVEGLLGLHELGWRVLPTSPPATQRPWVGLTDEEITSTATSVNIEFDDDFSLSDQTIYYVNAASLIGFTRALEAKLKELNNG